MFLRREETTFGHCCPHTTHSSPLFLSFPGARRCSGLYHPSASRTLSPAVVALTHCAQQEKERKRRKTTGCLSPCSCLSHTVSTTLCSHGTKTLQHPKRPMPPQSPPPQKKNSSSRSCAKETIRLALKLTRSPFSTPNPNWIFVNPRRSTYEPLPTTEDSQPTGEVRRTYEDRT